MATTPQAQTALDERLVEDKDLEKLLEDRERAKGAAGEARRKYSTLDDLAKEKVEDLALVDDETVRIGRFRISQVSVAGRSVSFETTPTSRLKIKTDGDD